MRFALTVFFFRTTNIGYEFRHKVYLGMQIDKIRIHKIRLRQPKKPVQDLSTLSYASVEQVNNNTKSER